MDQAVTLYFDLEEGSKADLATAARAALAFDAAIKELSFFLDPSLEVRLELDSGTPGSLKLNAIIRSVRETVTDKKTLRTVAVSAATWFALETLGYFHGMAMDALFAKTDPTVPIEDAADIAKDVEKVIEGNVGRREIEQVYREAEQDPKVRGIGVSTQKDRRPEVVVPRSAFPSTKVTSYFDLMPPEVVENSKEIEELIVTLISPVLVPRHRRWKFYARNEEFGAAMHDEEFLERVISGQEPLQLTAGIRMKVLMRTRVSETPDGEPKITRTILKVISVSPGPRQTTFDFSAATHRDPDGDDDE